MAQNETPRTPDRSDRFQQAPHYGPQLVRQILAVTQKREAAEAASRPPELRFNPAAGWVDHQHIGIPTTAAEVRRAIHPPQRLNAKQRREANRARSQKDKQTADKTTARKQTHRIDAAGRSVQVFQWKRRKPKFNNKPHQQSNRH